MIQEAESQPRIEVEPDSIEFDFPGEGGGDGDPFVIRNIGDADLRYSIEIEIISEPINRRNGEPDEAGYLYRMSSSPNGPDFEWYPIENWDNAEQLDVTDDWNSGVIELGFDFPWYGETYSSIRICSNGWVTFDEENDRVDAEFPQPPDESDPNNILLPNLIDLNPEIAGELWLYRNGNEFVVVSWVDVAHADDEEARSTFQIIINRRGLVVFQYGEMTGHNGEDVTIGYENQDGRLGATIEVDADYYLSESMAVGIGTNRMFLPWLSFDPVEGEIEPESEINPSLTLDLNN